MRCELFGAVAGGWLDRWRWSFRRRGGSWRGRGSFGLGRGFRRRRRFARWMGFRDWRRGGRVLVPRRRGGRGLAAVGGSPPVAGFFALRAASPAEWSVRKTGRRSLWRPPHRRFPPDLPHRLSVLRRPPPRLPTVVLRRPSGLCRSRQPDVSGHRRRLGRLQQPRQHPQRQQPAADDRRSLGGRTPPNAQSHARSSRQLPGFSPPAHQQQRGFCAYGRCGEGGVGGCPAAASRRHRGVMGRRRRRRLRS